MIKSDYKGLQTVTEGYRGLQGVFKRLQRVTRGYRGSQGVIVG